MKFQIYLYFQIANIYRNMAKSTIWVASLLITENNKTYKLFFLVLEIYGSLFLIF